jgi:nucleoid-associated protein YgaU
MGLFSFFKNSGEKRLKKEQEKAAQEAAAAEATRQANIQALKGAIASYGIVVKDLFVDLRGDKVIVSGEASTQEEREKVVLIMGNVEGIATVDDRMTVAAPPVPESKFHEVKKGDTLSKIAKTYYGDAMKYPVIFEANKPMLKDPNLIYPGQMLRIPTL